MSKKTSLFNALYGWLTATVKLLKQPLIERALKRRFDSFVDGCDAKIDEMEMELNKLREHAIQHPDKADVNAICVCLMEIETANKLSKLATKERKELFEDTITVSE